MDVDTGQKHVLTACQDRNVRIYSVNTGKHTRSFRGSAGDDGSLIKVKSIVSYTYILHGFLVLLNYSCVL